MAVTSAAARVRLLATTQRMRDPRRLAAIVSVDLVGFSRLMGVDEARTLAELKRHRAELIDPKLAEYGGRIVKTMGDGLLVEFGSVVDAVRCAAEVQQGMADRNRQRPADRRFDFRVGVNVGDIMIDGDDIFGDGVNVAARLQTLAEPGGICVSRAVRDQVIGKVDFQFVDLGPQKVKNIERPIEVYRIALDGGTPVPAPQNATSTANGGRFTTLGKSNISTWLAAGLGVAVCILVAVMALRPSLQQPAETQATQRALTQLRARAMPDQRSVAVLAFNNLSGDKENEYFSDGISDELLNVLQRIGGLRVAARVSAFSFKGKDVTAQDIGEKLNVAYLVEGSVRKAGTTVRINARLSRATTGEQLWSETYTRDLKDVFAVQTELAQTIVEQLRTQLGASNVPAKSEVRAQVQEALKGGTDNVEAYDLYLQGKAFLYQGSADSATRAAAFLERAVARDPSFALAWAALSRAHSVRGGYALTKRDFDEAYESARRTATRALALQPSLPAALLARMRVQMWFEFDWKGAAESLRQAQQLAAGDADVIALDAELAYALCQRQKAVDTGAQAVARDPVNTWPRIALGTALASAGRYGEAEAEFRRVVELSPSAPWGHAGVAQVFVYQQRFDDAVREAGLESDEWSRLTVQAQAFWGQDKKRESDTALARLIAANADTAAFQIAQIYAYRRDNDAAFKWLERAYRQHDPGLAWAKCDFSLARLGDDARWATFLTKLGVTDAQMK